MKPHIKRFLKDVELHISRVGSEDLLSEYRSHIISLVTCHLSVDSILDGIDQVQVLEAVRNSLQYMADSYSTHAIAPQIWNPFVACTLRALIDEVKTQHPDHGLKKQGTLKTNPVKTKRPSEQNSQTSGATKSKVTVPKPKVHPASVPPAVPTDEIRRQVETTLRQRKVHPFAKSPCVRCSDVLCSFCTNAAEHVPLTSCSSRTSHGRGKCHASGFWPHIGATLWAKWKHPHNAGAKFSLSVPLSLPEGALPPIRTVKVPMDGIGQPQSPIQGLTTDDEATNGSTSSIDMSQPGAWVLHTAKSLKSPLKRARRASVNSQSSSTTEG